MDLRFLDSLATVVACGSIAEAARQLHLTATGVAQRIHALEAEMGVRLIARSGRTVRPTAAAAAILDRIGNIQREVRDLKSIAASGLLSGELRMAITPTLMSGLMPDVLCAFARAHPQIELRVTRGNSAELYRKVVDGEVDAAVTSLPSFALPKTCQWVQLREEPFVVLTPDAMPARHPHAILAEEPFLRLDRKVYAGQVIDNYLRKAGIRPHQRLEIDGPEAIAVMVDRGLGVSLLPDWGPPWPEGLKLRKIALPDRSFTRRIGLLWLRASLRTGLIEAFLDQAESVLNAKTTRKRRGTQRNESTSRSLA